MQYEKISASNKYSVTLTLSRPMAEFLASILDQEISNDESYQSQFNGKKLRRLSDILWQYLKPTPAERERRMDAWVKKLNLGRFDTLPLLPKKNHLKAGS
jgi:hypothetical protein